LFTACPIEYVHRDTIPAPPLPPSNWLTVNIPGNFSGELTGTAFGYTWWSAPPAARPHLEDRVVTVSFSFTNGQMSNFVINYDHESYYYDFVANGIAAWNRRVAAHGIAGITEPLLMNVDAPTVSPNPYHAQWPPEYIDAFGGATITVRALSEAAFNALEDYLPCAVVNTDCICDECVCVSNDNVTLISGTGDVSGRAGGFLAALGDLPAHIAFVEVIFHFLNNVMDDVSISYEMESYAAYPETVHRAILNWETRVRNGGIQAIPDILPFDYVNFVEQHHLWPPSYVDAFSGGTISVNALTRAAQSALCRLEN